MIIKNIELENYRSHKNISLDLSKGINLILGENGSGKSSILEAIGSVIFDINDRTGKITGKNFIKYGEKSATVQIDFIGNDEREYRIKNKFYSKKGTSSVLIDLATGEEYKDGIREKLNELCGIKSSYAKIYDNIIIAKQNEFVNIFKEKPAKREEVFNRIFDTEIYLKMSTNIFKEIVDKYKREKEKIEIEKNTLNLRLEDENILTQEIEKEEEEKESLENIFKELKSQKTEKEKILDFYNEKKNKAKEIENKISIEEAKYKSEQNSLNENLTACEKRKKSREIVEENKIYYLEYQNLSNDLKKIRLEREEQEKLEKNNIRINQENDKLNWEINKKLEDIKEIDSNLEKEKEKVEEKEKMLQENSKQGEFLVEEGKKIKNLIEKIEKIEEDKNKLEKEKYFVEENLKNLAFTIKEKEKILNNNSILEIEKKLEEISKYNREIENLKKDITIFEEKNIILKDAKEKLKDAFCPLLEEKCQNIKTHSIDEFFKQKIENNYLKIKDIKYNLNILAQKISEESLLKNKKIELNLLLKEIMDLKIKFKEEELKTKELKLFLQENDNNICKILNSVNFENVKSLKNYFEKLKMDYIDLKIDLLKEEIAEKTLKIKENEKKKVEFYEDIEKNNGLILENKEKIVFGTAEKIKSLEEKIKFLEKREKEIGEFSKKYIENINFSSELEEFLKRIEKNKEKIIIIEKILTELEKNQENLSIEISKVSIEPLMEEIKIIDEEILSINKNLGKIQEQIKNKKQRLATIKEEKLKIDLMLKNIRKIENKIFKTEKIRENLKHMGLEISKYMLNNISIKASANFNKITGRTEIIEWSNEDNDKYAVYLCGKDGKIPFDNLSGGEQVSVAISIRETMTETFSNSRFLILDEPTNNLDKERKKLLAEYIGEMLNNLDQSIIVTHDDTFREMAERIIEL